MAELEERYARELVVVGVHSGKFIAERVTANIREAVLRLDLNHPVVNDRQFRVWRSYAVNAWPTLVVVDPSGYVVGQHAGEITADRLAPALERVIAAAESDGTLDRSPLEFTPEPEPDTALRFPAKVLVDEGSGRLYVADTSNHRVVVARLDGSAPRAEVEAVVGRGSVGFADGEAGEAAFHRPHGMTLASGLVYVADTANHAVRAIDPRSWRVSTVAGTGEQARRWPPAGGPALETRLNSPWDVLAVGPTLYVAMAGSHQLWRLDPAAGRAEPWVGSGAEALHDGPAAQAALAQPSGLATDGRRLFFADSESSAIRWASLEDGRVETIVGTGLFDFGDRDGTGDEVRLQHPLGVCAHGDGLLVADTYNGRIKAVDPATRSSRTWAGADGELWEPGGLAAAGGRVYVADTNHHRIVVVEPSGELGELELAGL